MTRAIRGAGRGTALAGLTFLLAGSLLLAFAPTLLMGSRGADARARLRRAWTRTWSRSALAALGVAVHTTGDPPAEPVLLATNHLGYLDVLVLGAVRPCVFVAKREVRSWPIWGWLSRLGGTLFVDRASRRDAPRAVDDMARAMEAGECVVLFPEGTTSAGSGILPLRSALLEAAVRTGRPLHFATLTYRTGPTDPPPSEAVCWWGDHEFLPHLLGLLRLDRVDVDARFGDAPLLGSDRKTLAARLALALESSLKRIEPRPGTTP